jgi:predicted DNA-binding transcriptional regulator YafY
MEIKLAPMANLEGFDKVYMTLRKALKHRRIVVAKYNSLYDKKIIDVELEPYTLFFSRRAWYVCGHTSLDNGIRVFKLNRFEKLEITDRRYVIPSDYSFDRFIGNAWNMIKGDKTYEVKVYFDNIVAENIADTIWHPTQKIKRNGDGGLEFTASVDGLDEVVWWIQGYGQHAKVLAPKELVTKIVDINSQVLNLYKGKNQGGKQ